MCALAFGVGPPQESQLPSRPAVAAENLDSKTAIILNETDYEVGLDPTAKPTGKPPRLCNSNLSNAGAGSASNVDDTGTGLSSNPATALPESPSHDKSSTPWIASIKTSIRLTRRGISKAVSSVCCCYGRDRAKLGPYSETT